MHKPDSLLEYDVSEALSADPLVDDGRVVVKVHNALVSLSGAVGNVEQSARAAEDASRVPGVSAVRNELLIGPFAATAEDLHVTAACLRALDSESHVPSGSVSLSVEDGVVTLSGKAHHHFQVAAAKRVVAGVDGVKRVVDNIVVIDDPIAGDISARIEKSLAHRALLDGAHIEVFCQDDTVFLEGTVGSWDALREAQDVAWNAPGVGRVVERLELATDSGVRPHNTKGGQA